MSEFNVTFRSIKHPEKMEKSHEEVSNYQLGDEQEDWPSQDYLQCT